MVDLAQFDAAVIVPVIWTVYMPACELSVVCHPIVMLAADVKVMNEVWMLDDGGVTVIEYTISP